MNEGAEIWRIFGILGGLIVFGAAGLSGALIVLLRPLLRRYALARPNTRSSHREPTPQGGGLAVIASAIVIVLLCVLAFPQLAHGFALQLAAVLCASIVMACVGVIDDLRGLGAGVKFPLQALAVAAVIMALPPEMRVFPSIQFWLERVLLVVGGVYFINIVNFMDGIDWITAVEVVPITLGLVLIGVLGGLPAVGVMVALALLGAILGFAPFNRPPASLFLGDVGSLPIGLLLGWLLLLLAGNGHLAAALLLPLYYLADATITLLRRLLRGERIWEAHRTHFYQLATDRGFSVADIDARILTVNTALVMLALATVVASHYAASLAALMLGALLVAGLLLTFTRGRR